MILSFDLWNTLIKSNPIYKQKRNDLFKDKDLSEEQTKQIVCNIENKTDAIVSVTGNHINEYQIIGEILYDIEIMKGNKPKLDITKIKEIKYQIETLFINNPPSFYDENTESVLQKLSKKHVLILCSNTGLIRGEIIRKVVDFRYFEQLFFSDECLYSKPNFKEMFPKNIYNQRQNIVHVGDNIEADYYGAINNNLGAVLIHTKPIGNEYSINNITELENYLNDRTVSK